MAANVSNESSRNPAPVIDDGNQTPGSFGAGLMIGPIAIAGVLLFIICTLVVPPILTVVQIIHAPTFLLVYLVALVFVANVSETPTQNNTNRSGWSPESVIAGIFFAWAACIPTAGFMILYQVTLG